VLNEHAADNPAASKFVIYFEKVRTIALITTTDDCALQQA